ncbi:KLRBC protein, partial [Chaetorhynchus papuensis]|nr:KLRBC protein [Chaetorhynchus papuensis]
REDCGDRGATLLLPRDRFELELFNDSLRCHLTGRNFWTGLWEPAAETGWTWVNGFRLDQDRFQLDHRERPGQCGTLRSSRIIPQDYGLELQWICQREAIKL